MKQNFQPVDEVPVDEVPAEVPAAVEPLSPARQKQLAIAAINAQVVAEKVTPEEGQRLIDELGGDVR